MKIIRWLLSHIFLILLIVVVIYGYMFWGNLAGQDTPAGKAIAYLSDEFVEVEEFVNAIKAKQSTAAAKQSAEGGKEGSDNIETSDVLADKGTNEDASGVNRDIEQEPVTISYSHNQMQVKQNSAGGISVVEAGSRAVSASSSMEESAGVAKEALLTDRQSKPVTNNAQLAVTNSHNQMQVKQNSTGGISVVEADGRAVSAPSSMEESAGVAKEALLTDRQSKSVKDNAQLAATNATAANAGVGVTNSKNETFVSPDVEQQLANVDGHGKVLDERQQRAIVRADWIVARKSFYQRNYELSEKKYQQVIDNTEDNYDAYGELGNIYFNQGKGAQAAAAYFEAAAIFVRTGQVTRAKSLMSLLRHLDKAKAVELQQLIQSAPS